MKVNIVCSEADSGWIYSKFIDMFRKYSKHEILLNSKDKCDLTYYMPYYEMPKKPVMPCVAWFSHQESKDPLKAKFISAAKMVSIPISHSKKYADVLQNNSIALVRQIIPGVDLDVFKMRSTNRPKNDKLIVGFVGRHYISSDRKNPKLLDQIKALPFVDFRTTGGKMSEDKIPKFYSGLDLILSPALIEGGPMSIQEALAVGVPVLCFEGVGVADEFAHGVIKVPFGNSKDFISRLEIIWKTKSYLEWRKPERMNQMRDQVKYQSWERFVKIHDKVFEMTIGKREEIK